MQLAKQSTAANLIVGPVLDSTGAEYTGAVIGDLSIAKNDATTLTALASAATLTHLANGIYSLVLTTGNTDTLGRCKIVCTKATYQCPPIELEILAAATFDTLVTNGTLASTTSGRTIVVDGSGLADANAVKVGPTGAGTAQTARDLGASVLLSSGTGTGQLDFTSGVVKANVTQFGGSAGTFASGIPAVNTTKIAGTAQTAADIGALLTGTGAVTFASLVVSGTTTLTGALTATNASNSLQGVTLDGGSAALLAAAAGYATNTTSGALVFASIPTQSLTVTTNGAAVDVGATGIPVSVCCAVGSMTGTTPNVTAKLQEASTSGGTWADISGQSPTEIDTANSVTTLVATNTKRWIRAVATLGGTLPVAQVTALVGRAYSLPANLPALAITSGGIAQADVQTIKTQAVTCSASVTVSPFVGSTGAAVNGTNANTLSGHDPGATLGTSTLTQTQVTGGAYALNSSSFAFNAALDLTTAQKASVNTEADTALADVGVTTTVTGRIDAAITTRMATYTQPTGFLAATFPLTVASPTNITAGTITTVTNLTNAPTAGDFTATMKTSLNAATPAVTVSDKTGFSLANGSFVTATFGTCDLTSTMKASVTTAATAATPTAAGVTAGVTLTSSYDFAKGSVALADDYAANGVAPTPAQAIMAIHQHIMDFVISGTSYTVHKLNGSTTAYVGTLNDDTSPTGITRT